MAPVSEDPALSAADPARLAAIAVDVARRAAAQVQASTVQTVTTKTSPIDLVTDLDGQVEDLVTAALRAHTPEAGVLGEERGEVTGSSALRWLIDPIDGTSNLVAGLPGSAVSIGAELTGRVVAGAIVDIASGEVFHAHDGGGAWLETGSGASARTSRLSASTIGTPAHATVGTGVGYDPARRVDDAAIAGRILPACGSVRMFGSAALQLAWTAAGRLDATYEFDLAPWDRAAGAVLCREAGARVRMPEGDEPGLTFVANPVLFDALLPLLDPQG